MTQLLPRTSHAMVNSWKYAIYIKKQGEEPRRVVPSVSDNLLEERVSRVRNCWPEHTVVVMRIIETLAQVYAPKCVQGEGDCEVNCSDRPPTKNGNNNPLSIGNSCL